MSEDLQRRKEGESEKAADDAIERRRDADAASDDFEGHRKKDSTSDDFEGHRHVAQNTDRHLDKFKDRSGDV